MHEARFSASPLAARSRASSSRSSASIYAQAGSCKASCSETLLKLWYGETPILGKIQMPSQARADLASNVAKTALCCFVQENHTKEDRPLAAPVLGDFVSDAHHIGRETSLYLIDRGISISAHRFERARTNLIVSQTLFAVLADASEDMSLYWAIALEIVFRIY
jgi:hypothetical protein